MKTGHCVSTSNVLQQCQTVTFYGGDETIKSISGGGDETIKSISGGGDETIKSTSGTIVRHSTLSVLPLLPGEAK